MAAVSVGPREIIVLVAAVPSAVQSKDQEINSCMREERFRFAPDPPVRAMG